MCDISYIKRTVSRKKLSLLTLLHNIICTIYNFEVLQGLADSGLCAADSYASTARKSIITCSSLPQAAILLESVMSQLIFYTSSKC